MIWKHALFCASRALGISDRCRHSRTKLYKLFWEGRCREGIDGKKRKRRDTLQETREGIKKSWDQEFLGDLAVKGSGVVAASSTCHGRGKEKKKSWVQNVFWVKEVPRALSPDWTFLLNFQLSLSNCLLPTCREQSSETQHIPKWTPNSQTQTLPPTSVLIQERQVAHASDLGNVLDSVFLSVT